MLAAALHVGYRLPLVEAFDAERSPLFMAEQGATLLGTALPMFQAYLGAQRKHGDEPLFPRLRTCVGGGAPKPAGIDEVIRRELGGLGVVSSWGLTEFPTATSASVDDTLEQIETTEGTRVARRRDPRRRHRRQASAARARKASSASAARTSSWATPTRSSTPTRSTSRATSAPATSASSPTPAT